MGIVRRPGGSVSRPGDGAWRAGAPRSVREVKAYEAACARLGLSPAANLLVPVHRSGVLSFRATGRAADALASRFALRREVLDGPRVLVAEGKKPLACAVCKATLPDGRSATATATAPLDAEGTALMSCETRARRLATLRVLGLEALAGDVREGVPQGYVPGVVRVVSDASRPGPRGSAVGAKGQGVRGEAMGSEPLRSEKMRSERMPSEAMPSSPMRSEAMPSEGMRAFVLERVAGAFELVKGPAGRAPAATLWDPRTANDNALMGAGVEPVQTLGAFLAACAALPGRDGAAALWIERRGSIASLSAQERTDAWAALVGRVRAFSSCSPAAATEWLKKAVRAEEERAGKKS